jgi:PPM family protein phosphatase
MKIEMIAKSDVGMARKYNEDYCGVFEKEKLAILSDGMGGHKAGAYASRLAVSTIRYMYIFLDLEIHQKIAEDLNNIDNNEMAIRLISSIRLANHHIFNKAIRGNQYQGMGTTVSALALNDDIVCIAHVGDSRVYRIRNQEMELLTEDHSWINELIKDNEIKKEQALQFEKKNVITRALGLSPTVKIDIKLENVEAGDLFLLCSDGLTTSLQDDEIKRIILYNQQNLDHAAIHLIDSANMANGSDNTTVSLVKILEKSENGKTIIPVSVTMKNESEEINIIENKILKQEFNKKNLPNEFDSIWKNKYTQITAGIFFPLLMILIFKLSFSNHANQKKSEVNEPAVTKKITENAVLGKSKSNLYSQAESDDFLSSQAENKKRNNSSGNVEFEKLRARSLNKVNESRGLIYIVGLEKIAEYQKSFIYVNNQLLGSTSEFIDTGINVHPGKFEIAIKDSANHLIFRQRDLFIADGEVKAIEYKQQ